MWRVSVNTIQRELMHFSMASGEKGLDALPPSPSRLNLNPILFLAVSIGRVEGTAVAQLDIHTPCSETQTLQPISLHRFETLLISQHLSALPLSQISWGKSIWCKEMCT